MNTSIRGIIHFFIRDRRFYFYLLIGGSAALVNIGSRYLLSERAAVPFAASLAIAYTLGLLWNFGFNKFLNYRSHKKEMHIQLARFFMVAVGGLLLTLLLSEILYLLLSLRLDQEMAELAGHVMAVGLVMLYSFAMHTKYTFREG